MKARREAEISADYALDVSRLEYKEYWKKLHSW